MTDAAIVGYCRAGYTKAGIYRPTFDKIVRRVEGTQPRSFSEIVRRVEATKPRTFQEIIRKLEG